MPSDHWWSEGFLLVGQVLDEESNMRAKLAIVLISITLVITVCATGAVWMVLGRSQDNGTTFSPTPNAITRLTQDSATNLRPVWSPDNRLIAFQSNRDGDKFHIYVMNADGSHLRALTKGQNDDRRPVWTADGKVILFDSFDGNEAGIWSVNVADGSLKQLTHTGGLASFGALSPDGKRMAFYVYKDEILDLWTAHADGTNAHPITRNLASTGESQCTFACHQPSWSPDSQWLTYTGGDGKSIWMMRADGDQTRCIVEDGETNHFPWFLPDGRLAYITEYVPPRYGGAWTNAWAYDLKTGQRALIQEFMAMQGPMDWNLDGSKILFHSPRAGSFDAYLIDLRAPEGLAVLQGTPVPTKPSERK